MASLFKSKYVGYIFENSECAIHILVDLLVGLTHVMVIAFSFAIHSSSDFNILLTPSNIDGKQTNLYNVCN
jgi:hypothetical protein